MDVGAIMPVLTFKNQTGDTIKVNSPDGSTPPDNVLDQLFTQQKSLQGGANSSALVKAKQGIVDAQQGKSQDQSGVQKQGILGSIFNVPAASSRAAIQAQPALALAGPMAGTLASLGLGGKKAQQAAGQGAMQPDKIPTFQNQLLDAYYKKFGNGPLQTLGGFGVSAVGLAADTATNPASVLTSLIPLAPLGNGENVGSALAQTQPGQALIKFMNEDRSIKDFIPQIHNQTFLEKQATNVDNMAKGMQGLLSKAYGDAYSSSGIGNVPVDSDAADEILLKSGLPDSIIKKIDSQVGDIDSVVDAHTARQIIRSGVADYNWDNYKGEYTPAQIKMNAMNGLKELMRDSTRVDYPEQTAVLEQLDQISEDDIYPRIDKFQKMIGTDKLSQQDPKTSAVLRLMRGRLGNTDVKIMKKTPEKLEALGTYFDSPKFNKELESTIKASKDFVNAMGSFEGRQTAKEYLGLGLLKKLFGI